MIFLANRAVTDHKQEILAPDKDNRVSGSSTPYIIEPDAKANTLSKRSRLGDANSFENKYLPETLRPSMPVAKLTIELEIVHAQSLKDRRQVLRSMKDKLRHSFNLSIAELDDGVVWNRATLGIAAISSSTSYLTGQLHQIDQAAQRIAATLSAEILDSYAEILPE
jgi:uncharacterized protein